MSIKVLAQVWEHSDQSGGALLVLLAIADFADDAGRAWPSVKTLARKARLSTRQTQSVIRDMENAGELRVESSTGPHGTNTYNVRVGVKPTTGGAVLTPLQSATGGGAVCDMGGVKPTSPKPSGITTKEPSGIITAVELLALFSEKETQELSGLFTNLDIHYQAGKCIDWWTTRRKKMKNPRLAFKNWLEKSLGFQKNGSSATGGKKSDFRLEKYLHEASRQDGRPT